MDSMTDEKMWVGHNVLVLYMYTYMYTYMYMYTHINTLICRDNLQLFLKHAWKKLLITLPNFYWRKVLMLT